MSKGKRGGREKIEGRRREGGRERGRDEGRREEDGERWTERGR